MEKFTKVGVHLCQVGEFIPSLTFFMDEISNEPSVIIRCRILSLNDLKEIIQKLDQWDGNEGCGE